MISSLSLPLRSGSLQPSLPLPHTRARDRGSVESRRLFLDALDDAHEVHEARSKASQAFQIIVANC